MSAGSVSGPSEKREMFERSRQKANKSRKNSLQSIGKQEKRKRYSVYA